VATPSADPDAVTGTGRELFAGLRSLIGTADAGASVFAAPSKDLAWA
jgi:phosphogluconate dehydratase